MYSFVLRSEKGRCSVQLPLEYGVDAGCRDSLLAVCCLVNRCPSTVSGSLPSAAWPLRLVGAAPASPPRVLWPLLLWRRPRLWHTQPSERRSHVSRADPPCGIRSTTNSRQRLGSTEGLPPSQGLGVTIYLACPTWNTLSASSQTRSAVVSARLAVPGCASGARD